MIEQPAVDQQEGEGEEGDRDEGRKHPQHHDAAQVVEEVGGLDGVTH